MCKTCQKTCNVEMKCTVHCIVGETNIAIANTHNKKATNSHFSQKSYADVLCWIRCRLSFSLLKSSIVWLRGARSSYHKPIHSFNSLDLALADGHMSH